MYIEQITVIIIIVLIIIIVFLYNTIIKYKNYVENAFYLIDVNLQKRADLIPKLVELVKAYKNFEKELLEEITEARSFVKNKKKDIWKERQKSEEVIWSDLKEIFARAEDYPDLKSNENFLKLQKEISRTEENLAAAREIYNSNLKILNTTKQTIPYNFIARFMNIPNYNYFNVKLYNEKK